MAVEEIKTYRVSTTCNKDVKELEKVIGNSLLAKTYKIIIKEGCNPVSVTVFIDEVFNNRHTANAMDTRLKWILDLIS